MSFETWLAFAAASAIMLAIPGPTVLLVLSYALGRGWSTAAPVAVGVALGDLTAMTLSLLGVGALLAGSATLFTAVKLLGAAYLVWLGVKLWRSGAQFEVAPQRGPRPAGGMIAHAWLVTTLNPKAIVFFVAFVPQFIDPARPFAPQAGTLIATFVTFAFLNAMVYAVLGARAGRLASSPRAMRLVSRAGGTALIGAGAATVLART